MLSTSFATFLTTNKNITPVSAWNESTLRAVLKRGARDRSVVGKGKDRFTRAGVKHLKACGCPQIEEFLISDLVSVS